MNPPIHLPKIPQRERDRMVLDPRCVLVEMPVVRALTGLRRDEIYDRADGASLIHAPLLWVWNMAADPKSEIRDLRFWRVEIETPTELLKGEITIAAVIARILPATRHHFHSGELLQMFALSRPALQRLRPDLGGRMATARNCFFDRAHVAEFLKTRWLGNVGKGESSKN